MYHDRLRTSKIRLSFQKRESQKAQRARDITMPVAYLRSTRVQILALSSASHKNERKNHATTTVVALVDNGVLKMIDNEIQSNEKRRKKNDIAIFNLPI